MTIHILLCLFPHHCSFLNTLLTRGTILLAAILDSGPRVSMLNYTPNAAAFELLATGAAQREPDNFAAVITFFLIRHFTKIYIIKYHTLGLQGSKASPYCALFHNRLLVIGLIPRQQLSYGILSGITTEQSFIVNVQSNVRRLNDTIETKQIQVFQHTY